MTAPERDTNARQTARILMEIGAILFSPDDPFTLTSGRKSPVYVDCRRLISYPRARRRIMTLARDAIQATAGFESLDVVAGGETAGIPFAAWIAEGMSLPMVYIRKKPKGFGRNARIEGHLPEGARALLVEDLATDGGSKVSFIDGLREADAEVKHTFVIFHYGIFPESEQTLADRGVTLTALATWWDALAEAESTGYLTEEACVTVRAFLTDPVAWQVAQATATNGNERLQGR